MRVAAGTRRGPKLDALRATLREIDPRRRWRVEGFEVPSGVRETPLGSREIRQGARRRADHLRRAAPGFDLYVGMEGGLARSGSAVWLENWAYVTDGARGYFGSGGAVPLPPRIAREVIRNGRSRADIRSREGTWGTLTGNLITRQHAFRDALVNALAPLLLSEPLYR